MCDLYLSFMSDLNKIKGNKAILGTLTVLRKEGNLIVTFTIPIGSFVKAQGIQRRYLCFSIFAVN